MRLAALFFFASASLSSFAADTSAFLARIQSADSEHKFSREVYASYDQFAADETVASALDAAIAEKDWKKAKSGVVSALVQVSAFEPDHKVNTDDTKARATKILSDPKYRDPGTSKDRNWMSRSFARIGKAIEDFFKKLTPKNEVAPVGPAAAGWAVVTPVVLTCLGIGLLLFITFFLIKFRFAFRGRAQTAGLLGDDEPDLTADEWLVRAGELEREQKFREAVRCLYLASLIRLDEGKHLNFVRTDTNWEHLHRFEKNINRPANVDLRTATKEFDRVWYGHRDRGSEDVSFFRSFYSHILMIVKGGKP